MIRISVDAIVIKKDDIGVAGHAKEKGKSENMEINDKVILYGSGVRCKNIIPVLRDRIECIIDSDEKNGEQRLKI